MRGAASVCLGLRFRNSPSTLESVQTLRSEYNLKRFLFCRGNLNKIYSFVMYVQREPLAPPDPRPQSIYYSVAFPKYRGPLYMNVLVR